MTGRQKHERLMTYYSHVHEAASLIMEWTKGVSPDSFRQNLILLRAVEREFEIIGEASKRIRDVLGEKHPKDSDWYGAMKMRDFIIHRYEQVRAETLLKTATEDAPTILRLAQESMDACEEALKGK